MHILEIDRKGNVKERDLFRKEIADQFSTHPRDLRSVFSFKQLATITPRKQAIIFNIHEIKMIIGADKAMIFDVHAPEQAKKLIEVLKEKIEAADKQSYFPFLVLETSLFYAYQKLSKAHEDMEKASVRLFRKLRQELQDENLEALLALKKRLNKLQIAVEEIEESVTETLKDDEDMQALSFNDESEERDEEIEYILEHAWERYEDLSHRIDELSENIDDTQEIITLKMSNRRNTIIRFDLFVSLVTSVMAAMAVVVGLFGMNLRSHLESDPHAFYQVLVWMLFLALVTTVGVLVYLRRRKVW